MGLAGNPGLQLGSKGPHWPQWVWERELGASGARRRPHWPEPESKSDKPSWPKVWSWEKQPLWAQSWPECRLSGHPSQAARASNTPEMLLNTVRSEGTQPSNQVPLPHHLSAPHQCPSTHSPQIYPPASRHQTAASLPWWQLVSLESLSWTRA